MTAALNDPELLAGGDRMAEAVVNLHDGLTWLREELEGWTDQPMAPWWAILIRSLQARQDWTEARFAAKAWRKARGIG